MRSLVNTVSDCWFPGWFPIPALISQMHQRGKIMPAFLHECLYCSALRHWSLLVSYTAQFYSWITVRKRDWIHTKPHQTWFPLHILECEVKPQNSALKERCSRAHKPGHIAAPSHTCCCYTLGFSTQEVNAQPWQVSGPTFAVAQSPGEGLVRRAGRHAVFGAGVHWAYSLRNGLFLVPRPAYWYLWKRHRFVCAGKAPYPS